MMDIRHMFILFTLYSLSLLLTLTPPPLQNLTWPSQICPPSNSNLNKYCSIVYVLLPHRRISRPSNHPPPVLTQSMPFPAMMLHFLCGVNHGPRCLVQWNHRRRRCSRCIATGACRSLRLSRVYFVVSVFLHGLRRRILVSLLSLFNLSSISLPFLSHLSCFFFLLSSSLLFRGAGS